VLRLLNDRCFQYFLASLFSTTFWELLAQSSGVPEWFFNQPLLVNITMGPALPQLARYGVAFMLKDGSKSLIKKYDDGLGLLKSWLKSVLIRP